MQIVGYETGGADANQAALVLSERGRPERVPLTPGTELSYTLRERHCAGALADGEHVACDANAAPYCRDHRSTWPCAVCTGDCDMPLESCGEEHAVYLAAFAPRTFKVGVTRLWRLETRLREQGADRAAHVRTVRDGRLARVIEARISRERGIPDRVRVQTKRDGLHRAVDEDAWADLLADFEVLEPFEFDYGLDLPARPVAETLATGTVRGTQGRLLVLDHAGSSYAVDVRDLVGYDVDPVATNRDVQSSLGTFG
ncbi:MAG: DUF2797 domain-containing protein [Salinigranum sp.]